MKHLNLFNSHEEFENVIMDEPWVAYDGEHVHYPKVDPFNGHEYVDLGLPSGTLWAKYNVGASESNLYGNYYQWAGITSFDGGNGTGPYSKNAFSYTKYIDSDGKTVLDLEDDVAHVNMGGNWVIPSKEDFEELSLYTNYIKYYDNNTEFNGVAGCKFVSKVDESKWIFLPAAGKIDGDLKFKNQYARYWTSTRLTNTHCYNAYFSVTGKFGLDFDDPNPRSYGMSIRGIIKQ